MRMNIRRKWKGSVVNCKLAELFFQEMLVIPGIWNVWVIFKKSWPIIIVLVPFKIENFLSPEYRECLGNSPMVEIREFREFRKTILYDTFFKDFIIYKLL